MGLGGLLHQVHAIPIAQLRDQVGRVLLAFAEGVAERVLGPCVPVAVDVRGAPGADARLSVVGLPHADGVVREAVVQVVVVLPTVLLRVQRASDAQVRAQGVVQAGVADADVHGVGVVGDGCPVQKVGRLVPYIKCEAVVSPVRFSEPGMDVEVEGGREAAECRVDASSFVVLALLRQFAVGIHQNEPLPPFLLVELVAYVHIKVVHVVYVVTEVAVLPVAVGHLLVFAFARQ